MPLGLLTNGVFALTRQVQHFREQREMAIPEDQLRVWLKDGATVTAQHTYTIIRNVLKRELRLPDHVTYHDYLQGSYRNSTTIRADSDVDLIVELTSTFYSDRSALTPAQFSNQAALYSEATYDWWAFQRDVLEALRRAYGPAVRIGKNSLKVPGASGRLPMDVVVCSSYRKYLFNPFQWGETSWLAGVAFWAEGRMVVNYPELHFRNGNDKNGTDRTEGYYKPVTRMFKNARSYLVRNGFIAEDVAPSYFIQCLLYNVPDRLFSANQQECYRGIVQWLIENDLHEFVCQNGVTPLFGVSPQQWSVDRALLLLDWLAWIWNNWGDAQR